MTKEIPLSQGKVALVDDEDYEWLVLWKWQYNKGYAIHSRHNKPKLRMHRMIMQTPQGQEVDHINGNGLDNRRCNLRNCTRAQNAKNRKRSGKTYKGVYRFRNKWAAEIITDGKKIYLGVFNTDTEAAKAYDAGACKYHGKFAALNFPEQAA